MTELKALNRNFLAEFQDRCKRILGRDYIPPVTIENFDKFEVVKKIGGKEKVVAFGLTLNEAKRFLKACSSHIRPTNGPNDTGNAYFEFEIYQLTVAGRERYVERPKPRYDPPDFGWRG